MMRTELTIAALALFSCTFLANGLANPSFSNSLLEKIIEPTAPQNIQVLIEQGVTEALLEVKGSYIIFNPHDGSKIASGILGKRFMIHATEEGLKWGEEFPGFFQIYLQPRSADTPLFVNGVQYSGGLAIFACGERIHIVNDLSIEDYVKSLLSTQVSQNIEPEVLASLAILTRTNAYYASSRNHGAFWHVSAADSAFQGSALTASSSSLEKAVDATKHLILVQSKGGRSLPFATAWTEHSAGKTASYQVMFRKEPNSPLASVDSPHAVLDRKDAKWNFSISKKNLAQALNLAQVKSIDLFVDKVSNKVYAVRVHDGIETHDYSFFDLWHRLGEGRLQSSDFTATIKDDFVSFSGFGKGHGVGMCLYSASLMAQNGDHAAKILAKFFPETYIQNLNVTSSK